MNLKQAVCLLPVIFSVYNGALSSTFGFLVSESYGAPTVHLEAGWD